ncbi:unnamed protein product [Plutella xylostella]|uniref:(diamondback moth) hypothetical protein n=1 Tax=Plutella xylostella TaxID=51655 RepID=A0A8S4FZL6_PLUXY|nr:unnamed protein product [Plutella xylostella]
MDVSLINNVLEGTRQYFMGIPKQAGDGQQVWPAGSAPPEEGAPAQSGAPAPTSRPPSAAAAPPGPPASLPPPRPPSEPLEPEPHIIHKATVMREALEKRREQPDPEDDDDTEALSPPSHIIRKPAAHLPPSPAPAQGAPCPSPARPPSAAPLPASAPEAPQQAEQQSSYRLTPHRVQTPTSRAPDLYATGRPPDTYPTSRPPEPVRRYHYETNLLDTGRTSHGPPMQSPQPAPIPRQSPQHNYGRITSSVPMHTVARMRDVPSSSPPAPRYMQASQPPPHNDRVPPIHHPIPVPPTQRPGVENRSTAAYPPTSHRRDTSPYSRPHVHYDRHVPALPRKYDPQQSYPGYRPTAAAPLPLPNQRHDAHRHAYKHTGMEGLSAQYATRPPERVAGPSPHETARLPRVEYNTTRNIDSRNSYHYTSPSTSSARYPPTATVPVVQHPSLPPKSSTYRPAPAPVAVPKTPYEYPAANLAQASAARSTVKPNYAPNQPVRPTVSVTSLVNQMNQTKQKRESPLDLSVKTVKNSADSSTTQDDMVDSASLLESKAAPLQIRPSSNSRHIPPTGSSHKVDFAPDFHSQYRGRPSNSNYNHAAASGHSARYNGTYETLRPPIESYPVESRQPAYPDRTKYNVHPPKNDYVPRIDLTRTVAEERFSDKRVRDDRNFIIEDRKRSGGPIVSNIPEKIVRCETWNTDSRIDHISRSAREQKELMSQPVYSYSSHKRFEAYQKEQTSRVAQHIYGEPQKHTYPYPTETSHRVPPISYHHSHYMDRNPPNSSNRNVIQKMHNNIQPPNLHLDHQSGIPADKRVLSILRNSLEIKQTGSADSPVSKQIPDLIVIDDADDDVEITDLTKETDIGSAKSFHKRPNGSDTRLSEQNIQMPKAVDSIPREVESHRFGHSEPKSKSPEADVASRIRTKAELKVMPTEGASHIETKSDNLRDSNQPKLVPKSQKQHLFNQIREDNLRLESVIKSDHHPMIPLSEVKTEPMNIDEIEKDAEISIKMETTFKDTESPAEDDLDWASACDSFMEQLKTGSHKKKTKSKRLDSENKTESTVNSNTSVDIAVDNSQLPNDTSVQSSSKTSLIDTTITIKQEPIDDDELLSTYQSKPATLTAKTERVDTKDEKNDEDIDAQNREKIKEKKSLDNCSTQKDRRITDNNDNKKQKRSSECEENKKQKRSSECEENKKQKRSSECEENKKQKRSSQCDENKKQKRSSDSDENKKQKRNSESEENKKQKRSSESGDKGKHRSENKDIKKDKRNSDITKRKRSVEINDSKKEKRNSKSDKISVKASKAKSPKGKEIEKMSNSKNNTKIEIKKEKEAMKTIIKEELESTDDDEPLIKSKLLKEKEESERKNYQLLKDLSENTPYVKLECFDVELSNRRSLDSSTMLKDNDVGQLTRGKILRKSRSQGKSLSTENNNEIHKSDSSSDSDTDEICVASRLRIRKSIKTEENKTSTGNKTPVKSSPKKHDSSSSSSTPVRKPGFGDGSDFRPGWEEELYRYKRSLRMPSRLIAIPRGRSGGPFVRGGSNLFTRGSTSLPDLDPAPLSPAPSSAPSAATDDLYARRQDKLTLDSDLDSNSSFSAPLRLNYDSEASTSTVFSSNKKKGASIVDVLIKKCGTRNENKKKAKDKQKEESSPKLIPKNQSELLPTPSLGLLKTGSNGNLSAKKEKLMEDIFYKGSFRKETVSAFRNEFINNTDGLIGATEEFAPVVLKSRTRKESRVLKQQATIKEVFGDERSASAPPSSGRDKDSIKDEDNKDEDLKEDELLGLSIKIEPDTPPPEKNKPIEKSKKLLKDKIKKRSSSIRDGLRSTKSLKRNDAKGRLLRLKKRNNMNSLTSNKKIKDLSNNKIKKEKSPAPEEKEKENTNGEGASVPPPPEVKRRFKRLFGRRKFSSGFDYIRKKKKIIKREDGTVRKVRRSAPKPTPESEHDIAKEIKGWFINKSIGETSLHRAARLGYTDCVAYCLEKMEADPSAKDNAGFTALHVAAARGHVRIARLLLQYGANVSAAAQGGIRPLHEASENNHVEMIRLLLSYGADPILGTYAGQTPVELAEGTAGRLLRLYIADVQGHTIEAWTFPSPTEIIDYDELGCDPLSSPPAASPPPPPDSTIEIQCTEAPLPPFYSLRGAAGQPSEGLWCLLQDITSLLQIKSKDSLLKQIHCGSGSPKELLREIRTQEFLERAQCHQLLCAGEKVNVRASKVSLVRVTDKLRQLLKVETVLVS